MDANFSGVIIVVSEREAKKIHEEIESLQRALDAKVDAVEGKDLSTNDYTNEEKEKLDGIEGGAQANVQPDWTEDDQDSPSFIKNKPEILDVRQELAVLEARVDAFEALPDGATTADAELIDIRVGADGTIYDSAGNAVRGQVGDLKSQLGQINTKKITVNLGTATVGTYKGEVGEAIVEGSSASYRRYAIPVSSGESYTVKVYQVYTNNYPHYAWAVNDNDLVIGAYGQVQTTAGEYEYTFTIPDGATKLLVLTNYRDASNVYTASLVKLVVNDIQSQINELKPLADRYVNEVYVSPTGNDANIGTYSEPFLTINGAINSGADTIYIKAGTYDESINISNRKIAIKPYDGDEIILQPSVSVNNCVYAEKCDLDFTGLKVLGSANYTDVSPTYTVQRNGMYLIACTGKMENCSSYGARTAGIRMDGSTLELKNCKAGYNGVVTGTDGFNAHDYIDANNTVYTSDITLINCEADHNGDDGVSVHEYGGLRVYGGKYTNNATGGVTPYGQCRCEVHDAYLAYNKFGIDGFQSADATYPDGQSGILTSKPTVLSVGNKIENNTNYALQASYYNIFSIGDILRNNGADTNVNNGVITQY